MFRQTALTDGDRACGHVTQLLEDAEESRGAGGRVVGGRGFDSHAPIGAHRQAPSPLAFVCRRAAVKKEGRRQVNRKRAREREPGKE